MYTLFISANHQNILSSKWYLESSFWLKYFFEFKVMGPGWSFLPCHDCDIASYTNDVTKFGK